MTRLNRILIATLCVQVALIVFVHLRGPGDTIARPEPFLAGFDADQVTSIGIEESQGETDGNAGEDDKRGPKVILLTRKADGWVLSSHYDFPAKKDSVDAFLAKLAALRTHGTVATHDSRYRQLGVAEDEFERKITVQMAGTSLVFFVGKPAGGRLTAMRRDGDSTVFAVSGLTAYAADSSPDGWMDRKVEDVPTKDVSSFEITSEATTYAFTRSGSGWTVQKNGEAVAPAAGQVVDGAYVSSLLSEVVGLRATEPADPAKEVEPAVTVVLHVNAATAATSTSTEAEANADAGAVEAPSPAPEASEQRVIQIGPSRDERRRLLELGRKPVWVRDSSLTKVTGFDPGKLFKAAGGDAGKAPAP